MFLCRISHNYEKTVVSNVFDPFFGLSQVDESVQFVFSVFVSRRWTLSFDCLILYVKPR